MRYCECNGCRYLYLLNDYYMCSRYGHNIGFVEVCTYSDRVKE
jgi:hypothetical protein